MRKAKKMKYSAYYKTSWHDTDANRIVRASKLITYLQETANRQCEESGLPLEALRDERGLAFILANISLKIIRPLHAYEDIEVRTWCRPAKGYIFNRYFEIIRDGKIVAKAATTWVLIDINIKSMVRSEAYPDMHKHFFYDEPIPADELPAKARIPKDAALYEIGKRKIVYSDIDYNMHMNNTHYPDMICDFLEEMTSLPPTYTVSSMSLSYVKESHLGATLSVCRSQMREDGTIDVRTTNEDMQVCLEATVQLARAEMLEGQA